MNIRFRIITIVSSLFLVGCSSNEINQNIAMSKVDQDDTVIIEIQTPVVQNVDMQDSSLFKMFRDIPYFDLKNRFRGVQTSSVLGNRTKWSIPTDSGVLFSLYWPDVSYPRSSRIFAVNEPIVYNPSKDWNHPEKDELLKISIVSTDIGVGPYFNGKKKEILPLTDFTKYNDTVLYKKDGLGILLILGFNNKDTLKYMRIGNYDSLWLDENIDRECDSFVTDFSRDVP